MLKKIILSLLLVNLYPSTFSMNIGITSIPKCGTYLLVKCIELLKEQKGTNIDGTHMRSLENIAKNNFFYCHLAYSKQFEEKLKRANFKIFFIYRDPRDQIVSHAFWMKKMYVGYKNRSIESLITLLIKFVDKLYGDFLPWLKSDIVCPIKFENLIGANGGGTQCLQEKEINKICQNLGIKSIKLKNNCIKNLFGNSFTFRKGQIGSWKRYFSLEQKNLFKKIAGNLLIQLGYENDFNW